MKVVVDTNIVFTALLNPSAKIGQILIFGQRHCSFYAPLLLKQEIKKHKSRILELANRMDDASLKVFGMKYLIAFNLSLRSRFPFISGKKRRPW